ncbi:unnamed protein product [Adineta ricciae]|uniref:Uncharacterized protein n=1 Tax=Adineta ricciae TaxID=249248 RepID=A0A815FSN1_ADIRI|nr:unnamed protein product [Adineta ricciae]CAF1603971.1 unnamed protein product [Adineta ricciae]
MAESGNYEKMSSISFTLLALARLEIETRAESASLSEQLREAEAKHEQKAIEIIKCAEKAHELKSIVKRLLAMDNRHETEECANDSKHIEQKCGNVAAATVHHSLDLQDGEYENPDGVDEDENVQDSNVHEDPDGVDGDKYDEHH